MIAVWFLYDIVILLGFFVYWPWAALKGKCPAGLWQRLGRVAPHEALRLAGHPVMWIHAVSIGEAQAMQPFLTALKARYPEWHLLLTTVTHTGQQIARTLAGSDDVVAYFPLDLPWAMHRLIRTVQPKLFLAVETELWPNAFRALHAHGIPIIIVNGRLSPGSFAGYRRVRRVLRPVLSSVELFLMQTTADAERLKMLGVPPARIRVMGNLKWDRVESSSVPTGLKHLTTACNLDDGGLLFVVGSTHPGEEEPVLRVFQRVARDIPQLRCLVAPRHIERVGDVSTQARRLGLEPVTYSRLTTKPSSQRLKSAQVVIVDTIGHLRHLYALATVAYVGGSLVPKGGQNPLEPAQFGKPILTGPHLTNFRAIADTLQQAGGLRIIASADELETALRLLLASPAARTRMGEKARQAFQVNQGAVERTLAAVAPALAHWTRPPQPYTLWRRGSRAYHWLHDIMDDRPSVLRVHWARASCRALSWMYAAAIAVWDLSYRRGWARVHRVSVPVISIGNLTMGGTGKSSCVLWLARELRARGWQPAIVTRGYGRGRGQGLGDEPTLFLRELEDVPVLVGWDRVRSARLATERPGTNIILLDDGFQHRRLHRDVDLITVDAVQAWGNGRLIPRGPLREPLTALARAHALVLAKMNLASHAHANIIARAQAAHPQLLLVRARHEASRVWHAETQTHDAPSSLRGMRVAALSSIGDPTSFEQLVRGTGATVGIAVQFPDHHRYTIEDVQSLAEELAQAGVREVITTDKDWVRLGPLVAQLDARRVAWHVLQITFTVDEAADVVDRLLRLCSR